MFNWIVTLFTVAVLICLGLLVGAEFVYLAVNSPIATMLVLLGVVVVGWLARDLVRWWERT